MKFVKKYLSSKMKSDMRFLLSARRVKISSEPVCDFCGDSSPVYVYAATRMSTGFRVNCWRWCACVTCSKLVDANDWSGLSERVMARLVPMLPFVVKAVLDEAVQNSVQSFLNDAMTE